MAELHIRNNQNDDNSSFALETKIIVRDELMGSGKSTRIIEEINQSHHHDKWIVVVPFLSECHRYAGTDNDERSGDKQQPLKDDDGNVKYNGTGCNASGREFVHPTSGYRSKVEHIEILAEQGKDIITTHAALKLFTRATAESIKRNGYRLVLDEELECVSQVDLQSYRRDMLLNSGFLIEDAETGLLTWKDEKEEYSYESAKGDETGLTWDKRIKNLADSDSLYLIRDSEDKPSYFIWQYPPAFIKSFKRIDVLTYNFRGSIFEAYLKLHKIAYKLEERPVNKTLLRELIEVVENTKMNKVGESQTDLSSSHQKAMSKATAQSKEIKSHLENFFKNKTYGGNSKTDERLWTCLKSAQSHLKGKGYTKRFIPQNTRATNEYKDSFKLAYIYNSFIPPNILNFFSSQSIKAVPDGDTFALNNLLQWLFRSRVRNEETITLYIPSVRMRNLLKEWLNN